MEETQVIANTLPRVPGYRTLRAIGAGGMATVYLAHDDTLDRPAAIKVISTHLDGDEILARFEAEAKTVAQLRHPHIVAVYASGEVNGQPYIVFEYVSLGSLADLAGTLSPDEALQIAQKMASALAYAHERGVIHRDIKPANILFNDERQPILSDFGIAKVAHIDSQLTQTGSLLGSPKYMAPEQLQGQQVTDKSDVYSLGLVVLEMLTGDVPAFTQVQEYVDSRLTGVLNGYRRVLKRCLQPTPTERPSAAECEQLFTDLLAVHSRRQRTKRAGWMGAGLAAVVALSLVLALGSTSSPPLPTYAQFQSFHTRFEDRSSNLVESDAMFPLFSELLSIGSVLARGESANEQLDVLVSRAREGDPAARVGIFLLVNEGLMASEADQATAELQLASNEGYALATYYLALDFRQRHEVDDAMDTASLIELRRLMALAAEQGLAFAKEEVVQIDAFLAQVSGP